MKLKEGETQDMSLEGCSMTIVSYPNLLFLEHHPSHVFANINSTSVMLFFKFGFDTTAASLPECLLLSFGVYKHPRNKAKEKLSLSHRINCSSFLVLLTVNILHFLLFFLLFSVFEAFSYCFLPVFIHICRQVPGWIVPELCFFQFGTMDAVLLYY